MRLNLYNISINKLFMRDHFICYKISYIYDAIFSPLKTNKLKKNKLTLLPYRRKICAMSDSLLDQLKVVLILHCASRFNSN